MTYDIPSYLRRKKKRSDWSIIPLIAVGYILMFVCGFILMIEWGAAHAHAEGIAGVVKGGQVLTAKQFCHDNP